MEKERAWEYGVQKAALAGPVVAPDEPGKGPGSSYFCRRWVSKHNFAARQGKRSFRRDDGQVWPAVLLRNQPS
jgi:hypothetical protein